MLKYCSIGSGSSGNCHVVSYKDTGILIDAGLAGKRITSGIEQADFDIDKIYTTTSSRTKDTVKKLSELKSIEIIEKESLKEISFGDFEGLTFDEIKDKYPKEFQDMIEKGYEYKYPNGESLIDSYNRVCIELDNIISNNDNRTILICSHGGTIRNIITYLISNSYKYHWNFKIDNGSVTILEVQDGFTVITAMNNTSFI